MPKQRITRDMVIEAAFTVARAEGVEQVLVKRIAEALHCSVQPIYSYCSSMESLRKDVMRRAGQFVHEYIASRVNAADPFRSTGQAYVQLAREEPHVFRMFVFMERTGVSSLEELYQKEAGAEMAQVIAEKLQMDVASARRLHLHMLIYTIGVGTIFSVTTPGIPAEEIFSQQDAAFQAFLRDALEGG